MIDRVETLSITNDCLFFKTTFDDIALIEQSTT